MKWVKLHNNFLSRSMTAALCTYMVIKSLLMFVSEERLRMGNVCEWEMCASGKFLRVGNIFWNVQMFGVLVQMLVRWLSKQNQRSDANSLQIFSFLAVWMFWMHKKRAGQQVIINSAIVLICCSLNVLRKKGECQQIIIKQTIAASHCSWNNNNSWQQQQQQQQ